MHALSPEQLEEKKSAMKAIRDEIVALSSSPLFVYRTENNYFPVIGEGSHTASIMFIGEAPGENEAKTGRPFCGTAGKILDEMLATIELPRDDVYITNIVKDRPPGNRDPEPEEIALYGPYLDRQIEIIKPQVIATLGRFSMAYIMHKYGLGTDLRSISKMHGQLVTAKTTWGEVQILPLYHPAATIYNRTTREDLKNDFQILKQYL
ncbi:MAG: uracil-DNA glycosylase [Patescibacteria group bacterium]